MTLICAWVPVDQEARMKPRPPIGVRRVSVTDPIAAARRYDYADAFELRLEGRIAARPRSGSGHSSGSSSGGRRGSSWRECFGRGIAAAMPSSSVPDSTAAAKPAGHAHATQGRAPHAHAGGAARVRRARPLALRLRQPLAEAGGARRGPYTWRAVSLFDGKDDLALASVDWVAATRDRAWRSFIGTPGHAGKRAEVRWRCLDPMEVGSVRPER
jgi:hypothetical protein